MIGGCLKIMIRPPKASFSAILRCAVAFFRSRGEPCSCWLHLQNAPAAAAACLAKKSVLFGQNNKI